MWVRIISTSLIAINQACGKVAACTTSHVVEKKGYASLTDVPEQEEDMLDSLVSNIAGC
jgi:ferredoxin